MCKQHGDKLASIDSEDTRNRILDDLKQYDLSYWWIGLRKQDLQWKWSNGLNLNRTVINFSSKGVSYSCGCLYQPGKRHDALLYDYGCSTDLGFYICESESVFDTAGNRPASDATNRSMIISLVSISIIAIIALTLLGFIIKRNSATEETPSSTRENQSLPNIQNRDAVRHDRDEDDGYATIDGVIYSEIDSAQIDEKIVSK